VIELVAGSAAFAAIWLLPGFFLGARWFDREGVPVAVALGAAFVLSSTAAAALGATLLAFHAFSGAALGIPLLGLAALGLLPFWRWLRRAATPGWRTAAIVALALPLILSALELGLQPSHSFQWYYWSLGSELTRAGGIPSWTLEFGEQVRWHPDYVLFSAASEGYRWLTSPLGESAGIVVWRAPVALAGLVLSYAVLRLWVSRPAAVCGTAAVSATTFFLVKFNAYKPESFGLVLGLAAVLLVAYGVRHRRPGWLLLAGVGFGVCVGVHGIAAAVTGALALGAGLAEHRSLRGAARRQIIGPAVAAVAIAAAIVLATGLSLQGRAVVASDAANPGAASSTDPTWVFLERHEGNFSSIAPPSADEQALDSVSKPWPSSAISGGGWIAVAIVALGGIGLAAASRSPRLRAGGWALFAWLAAMLAAGAFFALSFDTYIPRHTGVTRIGGYGYLLAGLAIALVAELCMRFMRRRAEPSTLRLATAAAVVFFVCWAVPVGVVSLSGHSEVGERGRRALTELGSRGSDGGGAVLSNVSSRGVIEHETGLEVPVEGRQPVIEDPSFLAAANSRLQDVEAFFVSAGEGDGKEPDPLLNDLDVRWVLAATDSDALGSPYQFGDSPGLISRLKDEPGLSSVWSEPGLEVFEVSAWEGGPERVGPARPLALRWIIAVAGLGAPLAVTAWAFASLPRRGWGWALDH
jgi:hypothetical protein